jgi:hypothetical protein
MNLKVLKRKWPWPNLTYYTGIYLEELRKVVAPTFGLNVGV